jgi:hypothetical protein
VRARAVRELLAARLVVVPTAGDYFMLSVPTEIGPKKSPSSVSSGCQTSCILSAESVSNSGLLGCSRSCAIDTSDGCYIYLDSLMAAASILCALGD